MYFCYHAWHLQVRKANGLSFDRFYLGLGGLEDIVRVVCNCVQTVSFRNSKSWKPGLTRAHASSQDAGPRLSGSGVHCLRNVAPLRASILPQVLNLPILIQFFKCFRIAILHRIAVLLISLRIQAFASYCRIANFIANSGISCVLPSSSSSLNQAALSKVSNVPVKLNLIVWTFAGGRETEKS